MNALNLQDTVESTVEKAKHAGAGEADAVMFDGRAVSVSVRKGELEDIERSEGADLGLRVIIDGQSAMASTSVLDEAAINRLVDRVMTMARAAPRDDYAGLPAAEQTGRSEGTPDLFDTTRFGEDDLEARAHEAEAAALAVKGVTNTEGAAATQSHSDVAYAATNGFSGGYSLSSYSLSASVLATGDAGGMERDYAYSTARYAEDLKSPAAIGREAGERTVRRRNPQRMPSSKLPLVFEPRVANSLLSHFAGAVNGRAVARGTSFLKNRMGDAVFPAAVSIRDDATLDRGLRSKPFDAEGVTVRPLDIVKDGVLQSWLLDCATARQLDLQTTGHAVRTVSSAPAPGTSNLYMEAGDKSPEDLIGEIEDGLYVSELIGMGVNPVTGDYSRGASGFRIRKGEIAEPVSEITIAGNLKTMFLGLEAASDLEFRHGINAPTLRIAEMIIAGQ